DTDPKKVATIRAGIAAGVDTSVCLLNYRADGTTFWNQFFIAALRDGGAPDEIAPRWSRLRPRLARLRASGRGDISAPEAA
ncbi:MAG: hypothetical protein AAFU55_15555, partial [Pseudomonadota bacterium]